MISPAISRSKYAHSLYKPYGKDNTHNPPEEVEHGGDLRNLIINYRSYNPDFEGYISCLV